MERTGRLPPPEYLLLSLVVDLAKQGQERAITLQDYLQNLRWLARRWSEHDALPFSEFVELLCTAFAPAVAVEASHGCTVYTFLAWERRIGQQIHDLSEMRQSGMLDRAHGRACLATPRGARWHNFDPCSYLECATTDTFSGWRQGYDTTGALREVTWREFGEFLRAGQGHGNPLSRLADPRARCATPA